MHVIFAKFPINVMQLYFSQGNFQTEANMVEFKIRSQNAVIVGFFIASLELTVAKKWKSVEIDNSKKKRKWPKSFWADENQHRSSHFHQSVKYKTSKWKENLHLLISLFSAVRKDPLDRKRALIGEPG